MVVLLVVEDPASGSGGQPNNSHYENQQTMSLKRSPHIDLSYFGTTIHGILILVQFILILIIKILPRPPYLDFVVQLTFILTSVWIWIYVFSLHKRYTIQPTWVDLEFFYTVGATFFYLVMTIIAFADASFYVRAAVFGLFTSIAFGASTFFMFKEWQELRQNRITTTVPATAPGAPHSGSGHFTVGQTNNANLNASGTGYI